MKKRFFSPTPLSKKSVFFFQAYGEEGTEGQVTQETTTQIPKIKQILRERTKKAINDPLFIAFSIETCFPDTEKGRSVCQTDRQFLENNLCKILNETTGEIQQNIMAKLSSTLNDPFTVIFPLQVCLPDTPQGLVICITSKQFLKDSFCVSLQE